MKRFSLGVRRLFLKPPLRMLAKGPLEGASDRILAAIHDRSYWRVKHIMESRNKALGVAIGIGWVLLLTVLAEAYLPAAIIGLMITCGILGGIVGFKSGRQHRDDRGAMSAAEADRLRNRNRTR